MFCHIVPSTYLKSWKIICMEHSIYVFEKNNLNAQVTPRNILNLSGTNFGKTNFFYLKMETCNYRIYDDLFVPIINEIQKNYIIEYKNRIINSPGLFRTIYLSHKQDIVVKKVANQNVIKIDSLNSIINSLWNDSQKRFIENFFNKNIENKWNDFLNLLLHNTNELLFNKENKKYLFLFISLQLYKDGKMINRQLKQLIPSYTCTNYAANNTQNKILIDVLYGFIFEYNKNSKNSNNIIYNTYLNLLNSNWEYIITINSENDFLTSDNPVFVDNYNNKQSILFPICPKMCLIISSDKKDKIVITNTSNLDKKIINRLIIDNADKNLAYFENYINQSLYN